MDNVISFSSPVLRLRWHRGEVGVHDPVAIIDHIQDAESESPDAGPVVTWKMMSDRVAAAMDAIGAEITLTDASGTHEATTGDLTMTERVALYNQMLQWAAQMGKDIADGVTDAPTSD